MPKPRPYLRSTRIPGTYAPLAVTYIDLVAVKKVSLDKKTLSPAYGGPPVTLVVNITPANATNKNVVWTSSNPKVATVNADGTVIPVSPGSATIKVTAADGKKRPPAR